MSADLLGQAARALRETSGPTAAEATFARVLRDVRRRRSTLVAVLPFTLILTTMGAWAATTGRLAAVARQLWPARTATSARTAAHAERLATTARGPEIVPLEPSVAPLATDLAPPTAVPPVAHRRRPPESLPAGDVAPPAPSPEDLYRRAHDAHFGRADYGAALGLWDQYLSLSPLPRFALEARFNRAIALVRLGRGAEAARALRPFADGDYGAYRSADARALLRTLAAAQNESPRARPASR